MWKWSWAALAVVGLVSTSIAFIAARPESGNFSPVEEQLSTDMGVSYLPLTPALSQYYGLTVNSGALVTEVVPGSVSEKAGLRVGDVIIAFNDTVLGEEVSLLGIIRTCPAGNPITLEFWRGTSRQRVKLVHTAGDGD